MFFHFSDGNWNQQLGGWWENQYDKSKVSWTTNKTTGIFDLLQRLSWAAYRSQVCLWWRITFSVSFVLFTRFHFSMHYWCVVSASCLLKALLQNSAFKILLIRTNTESAAALSQQDPPLPSLVQRALKVLPSLNWTSGRPTRATCNFWRSLRKAMPDDRVKLMSQMQEQGWSCEPHVCLHHINWLV